MKDKPSQKGHGQGHVTYFYFWALIPTHLSFYVHIDNDEC